LFGATQLGGEHDALGKHERERDGTVPGSRRLDHEGGFRNLSGAPPLGALASAGASGDDGQPLISQRWEGVSELIEGRGCQLLYLPPYSPDLNPIEEAFAKLKALLCAKPGHAPAKH
jgi:hypothetical protein